MDQRVRGASKAREYDLTIAAWAVWSAAYYQRIDHKKFPKSYQELLPGKRKRATGPQTHEQMKAIAQTINATMGGKVKKRKR